MDKRLLDEIIACLPNDRTLFRYARDDYALMLLSRYVGQEMKIADLRRSPFAKLLEKPNIKNLLRDIGGGRISGDMFDYVYVEERQEFVLTVGRWNETRSRYNQTSRNERNLVLQLNFNTGHDGKFNRLLGKEKTDRFVSYGHPVLREGERNHYRHTMAWVRMDVDFKADEVLIEEIQTDWLRYAKRYLRRFMRCDGCQRSCERREANQKQLQALKDYVGEVLSPYLQYWDEAALTAAIGFAVDELGVGNIYYHTFDTGNVLKDLRGSQPPRSLYTDLPRKFCFELTDEIPRMFHRSTAAKRKLKKTNDPHWYRLNMEVRQ